MLLADRHWRFPPPPQINVLNLMCNDAGRMWDIMILVIVTTLGTEVPDVPEVVEVPEVPEVPKKPETTNMRAGGRGRGTFEVHVLRFEFRV